MILSILIIHNRDRISSINRVLHTTTWEHFTLCLHSRFIRSSQVVKEAIMTDINDLVQEFLKTSSDAVGASFFAMRRLLKILHSCSDILDVCFDIISVLGTALANKNLQAPLSRPRRKQSQI